MQGKGSMMLKMLQISRVLVVVIFSVLMSSCEKEIDVVPADLEPLLVVEGSIENEQFPRVILTRSVGFFDTLSLVDLANSFVRNATVTVNDGSRTVPLKEYSIQFGPSKFFFYSVDTTNPAIQMKGEFGKRYTLNITAAGKSYSAVTQLPTVARRIDSLWWQPAPGSTDTNRVVVFSRITDPPGFGNFTRYFTSVNDSSFLPGLNSVSDDQFFDGTTFDVQTPRGVNRNVPINNETFGFYTRGEKVKVKLSNIDKATFDFWRTWEQNQSNTGNPFGVPIRVLGNISNGALGYFGGYGSQVMELAIPK
jgi:hypothetical protein